MASAQGSVEGAAVAALREMRRARRRRYVEQIDVMEVLYRVYVGAIFAAIGLAVLGGVIHEAPATPAAADWLRAHGPALIGAAVALALFAGLRSGSHGGPLAIEAAEVQHVLLAPVDRGVALRPAALAPAAPRRARRRGRSAPSSATSSSAACPARRSSGSAAWRCSARWCRSAPSPPRSSPAAAAGARCVVSGVGFLLLAWSGLDAALGWTTSPATMLGELATLPVQHGAAVVLAALGAVLAAGPRRGRPRRRRRHPARGRPPPRRARRRAALLGLGQRPAHGRPPAPPARLRAPPPPSLAAAAARSGRRPPGLAPRLAELPALAAGPRRAGAGDRPRRRGARGWRRGAARPWPSSCPACCSSSPRSTSSSRWPRSPTTRPGGSCCRSSPAP